MPVEATMAEFVDQDGRLIAILGVIPCHPVTLMGIDRLSSDYVGRLREKYKEQKKVSAHVPFVFLQGASGDLNPWFKSRWLDGGLLKVIDQAFNGVAFSLFTSRHLELWAASRVREILAPKAEQSDSPKTDGEGLLKTVLHELPLKNFLADAVHLNQRRVYLHRVQIEHLDILGVSAEVTSDLRRELGHDLEGVDLVGCIRDSFGYVTSFRQYQQGGYEVEGHQSQFSISHLEGCPPGQVLRSAIEVGIK